ncbi:MAG TPA: hypothetical protein VEW65_10345 [Chryseolinea sp.]|nr:hypothetical protein [Chryseolinea sp.]
MVQTRINLNSDNQASTSFFKSCAPGALIVFLLLLASKVIAQDADSILTRYFEVVSKGDARRWQNLKSNYIESISSFSDRMLNGSTPDFKEMKVTQSKLYRVWPDLFRLDTFEDSVLVGSMFSAHKKRLMVMGNMPPIELSPGPYDDVVEFMPLTIQTVLKKGKHPKFIGVREIEGNNYLEVEIITKVLRWYLYFNENTYHLAYWNNSPDGDKSILTRVFNYKEIDGLMFNMSEYKIKNGVMFFWQEIKVLEIDKEIDERVFEYQPR